MHRSIYGALEPKPPPVLLVADAASSFVAVLLQQTFQAAAHAQGQRLAVHDLAPLPPLDPTGATSFSATLSLVITGILGTSMLGRVLAKILTDESDSTGMYYDENGKPMTASAQVRDPASADRVVAETRAMLAASPARPGPAQSPGRQER